MVEVTNTPWHERTAYVLDGTGTHRVAKGMHVSPFLPMGLTHRFTLGIPGRPAHPGRRRLRRRRPRLRRLHGPDPTAGRACAQGRLLWRFPLMTVRVSLGIYRQALALKRKGVPFHRHPDKVAVRTDGSTIDGQER